MASDFRGHVRESMIWYGGLGLLAARVVRNLTLPPSYFWLVAREIDIIGVRSLTVALTAALFTGMVLALQTAVNMARFGAESYVGPVAAVDNPVHKPTNAPIALELKVSNVLGTVAMARTNVLNSATSEFFINLGNNDFLDVSSGGYAQLTR